MKKWQAALLSLVTFIIGGSGGLMLGGLGGSVVGVLGGACLTARTAMEKNLITEEQSTQLLTSLSEQFIAQGGGKSNPETLEKVNRGLQSCLKDGKVNVQL